MLNLVDVTKSYPHPSGEVQVLSGLNASVKSGERVAVLGPSGSGKSTLLALLAGLDRPQRGRIELGGADLAQLSEKQLTEHRAKHLGIIFQQFHLLAHLSAQENVMLPLRILNRPQAADLAALALRDVGLGHRLQHRPPQLSGGECQRVAIARAMVTAPSLLLADEPSGNLDVRTGEQVMRLLFDLVAAKKSTLILVTHNEALAAWCDRRLLLGGGKLSDA